MGQARVRIEKDGTVTVVDYGSTTQFVPPYPPRYSHVSVRPKRTGSSGSPSDSISKWPGGMICVPAYQYNTGGTVGSNFSNIVTAAKNVSHNQSVANFAAAAETFSFTVEQAGIPTNQSYQVWIGAKVDGAPTGAEVKMSPKPPDADAGDSGYPTTQIGSTVQTYYGLWRLVYSDGAVTKGHAYTFSPGETLSFKAYRTGGTGTIYIDCVYLIPVGEQPDSPGAFATAGNSTIYTEPSGFGVISGTASYQADNYQGYDGDSIKDTQERGGIQDTSLTYSCVGYGPDNALENLGSDYNYELFHPRHAYAMARINGSVDQAGSAGNIAIWSGGVLEGFGNISEAGWAFVYCGLIPNFYSGEQTFAAWQPQGGAYQYDLASGDVTDVRIGSILYISSIYDWNGYDSTATQFYLA